MPYIYDKVKNKNEYIIRHDRLDCKELWMFMADDLGFKEATHPAIEFIAHVSNSYPSVEILREFYCDETSHRYSSTAGFLLVFGKLADAKKFVAELNKEEIEV